MQNVSAEWIDNQNSLNQKQGYVIIEIEIPDGSKLTISTLDTGGRNMKQITHKRGYDPVGLSLPYNNCTIELFNYNKEYDFLYDNYEYANLPVTVKYGFCLSNNETIPGGKFVTSVINKEDDILVIECVSTFELRSETNITFGVSNDSDAVLFYAPGSFKTDLTEKDLQHQFTSVKGSAVAVELRNAGVSIITTQSFDSHDVLIYYDEPFTVANSIQYIANLLTQKGCINRNDVIEFSEYAYSPQRIVKMMNMYNKAKYSRSSLLKNIAIDSNAVNTTDTATVKLNQRNGVYASGYGYPASHEDLYMRNFVVDYTKSHIAKIEGPVVKVERKRIGVANEQYVDEFGCNVLVSPVEFAKGFEVVWTTDDVLTITVAPNLRSVHMESRDYNPNGIICDINNPYGIPDDLDKIAAYFSNRDMYEINMRGDPSSDIGDYIWLSLEDDDDASTYKKALILESELVFDGSFKETLKVRVIDNDFEPISGNTHADLSKYTHTKLSGYTHKQLMTEAIQ